jgi:hypothetical protein
MDILQGDTWKIDGALWVVTSVDALRSTCCMSGPLPCRGMQTMALSFVRVKGMLVWRREPDNSCEESSK